MKKDRLYTYGKKGNIFWPGGELNNYGWVPEQMQPIAPPIYRPLTVPTLPRYENFGSKNLGTFTAPSVAKIQPLSSETIGKVNDYYRQQQAEAQVQDDSGGGNTWGMVAAAAPREAFDILDPVYHLAAGRETKVGNALSDTGVGLFKAGASSGNPGLMIAGAAAKIGGGLINAGWGIKENKENTAAIKQNTALAKSVGNELGNASTNSDVLNAAGSMTSSLGFKASDLYKNGWFTKKGTKKGNALNNQELGALAYQNHGLVTGANNADYNMDSNIMSNFAAFGGPLDYLGNNDMGAIEYGFMSDYLTNKKKQAENKGTANLFAGMPASMFGEGGSIEIKHPGRLTELKKRTGKTEAELWAEGNPGVRKMITFARNARKWSKALGGKIERDGVSIPDNVFCSGGKMFALGGPEDDYAWNPVDTRSDTTRRGYHEGTIPYGAAENINSPLALVDALAMRDTNPNLVTGVVPIPGKPKAKNALEALQMVRAMKAAKAEQAAAAAAKAQAKKEAASAARGRANSYAGKTPEQIEAMRAQKSAAGRKSGEVRKAEGINSSAGNTQHWEEARAAAAKREQMEGLARSMRETTKAVGRRTSPSLRNAQGKRSSTWGAITADDIYAYGGDLFALGGDVQSNGADFTTGMSYINAGGSHEENPNQGVQVGVDQEGTPNLVEEGETIFNDYVYSNRITADEETKKKFHIGKKREITFADLSKKLEKEASERPNDPISQAALQAQMADLANEQERQKQEMEAAKAQAAFESLTPEEKVGVMQYAQQQDQMAQEQAIQEQMMAQQYAQPQQPIGLEEAAMMQQQQMPMQEQPILGAYGGNLFLKGGALFNKMYSYTAGKGYSDKIRREIAQAMVNRAIAKYGNSNVPDSISPRYFYNDFLRGFDASEEGYRRNYNDMRSSGMSQAAATAYLQTERGTAFKKNNETNYDARLAWERKAADWENRRAMATDTSKKNSSLYGYTEEQRKTGAAAFDAAVNRALEARETTERKKKEEVVAPQQEAAAIKPVEEKPKANASKPKAQAAPKAAASRGSNTNTNGINVGTYRQEGNQWNTYGLPGLQDYLNRAFADYDLAENDEARQKAAQNIVDTLNGVQQSYWDNIVPTLGQERQQKNAGVGTHQTLYNTVTNNAGFKGIDPITGQVMDLTDQAIVMPEGHNTTDNLANGWVDEYSGPKTWLRYLGASGDALDSIVEQLKKRGIDYSPYKDWTIGEGDNARQLYRASLLNSPVAAEKPAGNASGRVFHAVDGVDDGDYLEGDPSTWNGVGAEVRRETLPNGDTVIYHAPLNGNTNNNSIGIVNTDNGYDVEPIHRNEKWRYAGLFGPAVGLGMQALGIGRPDTKGLDAVLEGYDRRGASYADYKPIGNYLTYRPMDIWSEQNRLNASSRATDRAIMNSTSPSRMAGLLASGYNDQLASGQLYRQALEYNDNLRKQVGDFNRGTDMFNAQAYNQVAQFNASQRERDRQLRAQLGMQAAMQKADMDAAWYNGIYGNVAGLFKGIGDLGRENAQHNMIADMAATGIFGTIKNQPIANGYVRVVPKKNEAAKGGKVCRKKGKRGLTF